MSEWAKIVKEIKELKIQSATNVAKAAIDAWEMAKDKKAATKALISARPTEPMLRNVLKFLNKGGKPEEIRKIIATAEEKIVEYGSNLVESHSLVYTHCHSSIVEAILEKAKNEGKELEVHVTETRPDYQGRITAANLAKRGIKVTLYVDSAVEAALKNADLMFIGADAVTAYGGIVNKIGSSLFARLATEREIPVYVATEALKYDPATFYGKPEKIEQRSTKEVWAGHPKGVRIVNNVFDFVPNAYITSIVTELGVMPYEDLLEKVKEAYSWI